MPCLARTNSTSAPSIQGDIALVTERLNTLVIGVVMDTRGIYMSKTPQEADTYAKGNEARFPQMRKLVADLKQLVPSNERERVAQIEKARSPTSSRSVRRPSAWAARSRRGSRMRRATTTSTAPTARA
jgi:hypothetical protein